MGEKKSCLDAEREKYKFGNRNEGGKKKEGKIKRWRDKVKTNKRNKRRNNPEETQQPFISSSLFCSANNTKHVPK